MKLLQGPHVALRHEFFHVERILQPESDLPPKRTHRVIAVTPWYGFSAIDDRVCVQTRCALICWR